jgi:predicted nucleic acid-binding protein
MFFGQSANAVLVVDASVVVELLLNRTAAARIRDRIFCEGEVLHAPHLIDLEVLNVLRRYVLLGEMSDDRALTAIAAYRDLPIERHSHEIVLPRVWALRSNFTAYDAAYVALAELLGTPLVTTDKRLAKAAPHVADLIR